MSAPSLLADNPSARIEIVQGGGGMTGGDGPTFSADEIKILTQYELQPGGGLDDVISPPIKKQFLEQLAKSNCAIGTGENVILNSECSAVAQVIRAMIIFNMKRTNGWGPKNLKVSAKPPAVPGARQPVQPPPVPGQPIDTGALIATIRARIDERHNGLANCGNTCYLNSALQMFSYVPELVNEMSKNSQLYSIFNDLYKMPFQSVDLDNPTNKRLTLFNGMFPVIKTQQDVTEFIMRFYERFRITADYFKIKQIFTTTCLNLPPAELGLPERRPEERLENSIELPINNGSSIQELIHNTQQPEEIKDVEDCLTPGSPVLKGPATRVNRFEIPDENRYLIIALKRFKDTGRTEKDAQNRNVPIFERIDTPIEINREIQVGGVEYQVYGTILHTGTLKGGHYRFIKLKSDFSGCIVYNDETVTEQSNIPDIRVDTYVAIYKRMNVPAAAAEPPAAAAEPSPAPGSPAASAEPSPAPSSTGATVDSSEEAVNEENNTQGRMSAGPGNLFANNVPEQNPFVPAPVTANVNYSDEYYEENPSNFQPGHLRMKFNDAPGNRRVYANTTVGTRRTRIYGTNAANIKRKFNSRTRKLKAAANRAAEAARTAARVASETREAAQKAKNSREAAARAAAEAKKTLRTMETTAAKQAAANEKAAIKAKIAAGEKVSFMNRMRAKFGGSRRTRRKSRKSRRGGRK